MFQFCDGVQAAASGALRGLKVTQVAMRVAGFSYWVVGFPVACLLAFPLGLEGVGLWWGMVLGLTTAAVLLTARFRREVKGIVDGSRTAGAGLQ